MHLIGLVSDGGVHSSDRHLKALIELAGGDAIVHAFTDGRDTDPKGGAKYLADVESWGGRVGSVVGRYFAMDRDKRWDRDPEGLRPARARQGRAPRGHGRGGRAATPTSAARPTSSSSRRRSARRRASGPATP